ncbi:MAG TPA: BON domain-containing protein [Candidatus Angelobacter sp.]|nr:BON domain-containing protein [Candidatus Angelobacter sp.]
MSLSLNIFVLALGIAFAGAQTRDLPNNATVGQSRQGGTAQSATAPTQSNTSAAGISGAATAPSGAAVNTGNTQVSPNPQAAAAVSDSDLQSQIQQALNKEPTLTDDTVNVVVSGRSIDLSGRVATARQKLTATRIVESYATNRKVMDHLTIGNTNSNAAAQREKGNEANNPARPDLSSHPEPEKGSPPGTATRPPQ